MHNCVKTRDLLIDLVFDELEPEAGRRALLDIEGCPDCLAEYRSMAEALRVFDQAAETALPGESYWPSYEARLRERLRTERRSWMRRLANWISGFGLLTTRPIVAAAGLALVLLAIGWLTWQRGQSVGPSPIIPDVVKETPARRPKAESPEEVVAITPKPGKYSNRRTSVHPIIHPAAAKPKGKAPSAQREERGKDMVEGVVVSRKPDQFMITASLFAPETIRHFEKAQLMLRSFRNASAAKSSTATDLAYERQLSRRLLYQNILLRRDAEMKGNLPAEEALNNLEPFLLDIANLPDNPSSGELSGIRERLRRKELITSLQIASSMSPASTYQIP